MNRLVAYQCKLQDFFYFMTHRKVTICAIIMGSMLQGGGVNDQPSFKSQIEKHSLLFVFFLSFVLYLIDTIVIFI